MGLELKKPDLPAPVDLPRPERLNFGEKVRRLRKARGWTLEMLGKKSGISISTISKAERGVIAMTYDNILKLAFAFELQLSELLSESDIDYTPGIVTIERRGCHKTIENKYYILSMLCSHRAKKRMIPVYAIIKAHSVKEFAAFITHPGEEFVYVLQGQLTFQFEGKVAEFLEEGDCLYFDSGQGHAYMSTGAIEARLLVVCWHPPFSEIEDAGVQSRMTP